MLRFRRNFQLKMKTINTYLQFKYKDKTRNWDLWFKEIDKISDFQWHF